ncbi:MAG: hypothetical protein JWQ69_3405 [Pseudomonas sp.]|nr:hypothetical protein [Pseudomonas sp.]
MYPTSSGEQVEICLSYSGRDECYPIRANSTGYTIFSTPFRYASMVIIRHKTTTGEMNSKPAGQDVVRFNLSY